LFVYTNYIKLDSSTCFERIPPIIRRSFLSGCTRQSFAESDDTRGWPPDDGRNALETCRAI